ncbi:MAG: DUF5672 family protein [Bacteroidota bacterium]
MGKLVKVVIPIYKSELDSNEYKSLIQCEKVLHKHPKAIVCPFSIFSEIKSRFPHWEVIHFEDIFFKGIEGYNTLMLSKTFYNTFSDFKYILIYQLDAWVFRDELITWCEKDYDYIGAPWLLKPKYYKLLPKLFLKAKAIIFKIQGRPFRKLIVGDKVGNGGFSLRKVTSFLNSIENHQEKINFFLNQSIKYHEFNEDVYWATQNPDFKYPGLQEALLFAIDQYPDLCYELNGKKLPFGCHGWSKASKFDFWKQFIS